MSDYVQNDNSAESLTQDQAKDLLSAIPPRPRRELTARDHLSSAVTILASLASGVLALSGHGWWAIAPGIIALMVSHWWIAQRRKRANEPRLRPPFVTTAFAVWMALPIWRNITRGEVVDFPEGFLLAGLAPTLWLIFYVVVLVRR